MNSSRINSVTSDLAALAGEAREAFGDLTVEQLNWKASEKNWSVAQCLDHLITINSLYFPIFEKLQGGAPQPTLLEKFSPFSGFFGRFLIKAMSPETTKKMNTSKKAYPSASEIGGDIVERFVDHNRQLADHIEKLPTDTDLARIITSPLAGFVTYSLDDCLTMLVVHERRHMLQARRVFAARKESGL
jgi:uncharacterized damage-inducible protein DinB